jgi:hypothetical protein
MKNFVLIVLLIGVGFMLGQFEKSPFKVEPVNAQDIAYSLQGNDALWHLPKFAEAGWFVHASNGRVRACNLDKVSVVGDKKGPRCTNWE